MFYKLLNAYSRRYPFPHRGLKYFLKVARWLGIAHKIYIKKLPEHFCMMLMPSEHIQQQLFWYGHYEKELSDIIKKIIQPDDVFLDIGANIGYFSLLAANKEATSRIFSFEPVKVLFEKLKENISINDINNITPVNVAVGEADEDREIFIAGADNLGMSSFQPPENYSGEKEKVKVISIDNWIQSEKLSKVDLVKLDIEGSELAALKGMQQVLENFKPLVIVEINPATLRAFHLTAADIYSYLNKLNFGRYLISKTRNPEPFKVSDTEETVNVLFVHPDKMKFYQHLFNN